MLRPRDVCTGSVSDSCKQTAFMVNVGGQLSVAAAAAATSGDRLLRRSNQSFASPSRTHDSHAPLARPPVICDVARPLGPSRGLLALDWIHG
jgi:hypothetical protein